MHGRLWLCKYFHSFPSGTLWLSQCLFHTYFGVAKESEWPFGRPIFGSTWILWGAFNHESDSVKPRTRQSAHISYMLAENELINHFIAVNENRKKHSFLHSQSLGNWFMMHFVKRFKRDDIASKRFKWIGKTLTFYTSIVCFLFPNLKISISKSES